MHMMFASKLDAFAVFDLLSCKSVLLLNNFKEKTSLFFFKCLTIPLRHLFNLLCLGTKEILLQAWFYASVFIQA